MGPGNHQRRSTHPTCHALGADRQLQRFNRTVMVLQFPHGLVGPQGAQHVENVGCYPIAARLVPRKVGAVKSNTRASGLSCSALSAAELPAGPAPTTTTSQMSSEVIVRATPRRSPNSREPLWKVADEGTVEDSPHGRTMVVGTDGIC